MRAAGMDGITYSACMHPATQKAELKARLKVDRVATSMQLKRAGLLEAAIWLNLPSQLLTLRLRSRDPSSDRDALVVGLTESDLRQPQHQLTHLVLLAELRSTFRLPEPWAGTWHHLSLSGRPRGNKPDAELLCQHLTTGQQSDIAVEADAGYDWAKVTAKLEQAALDGYAGVLWGTTLHIRPPQLIEVARHLHEAGRLPGLKWVDVHYIDPVAAAPYGPRPRARKGSRYARLTLK